MTGESAAEFFRRVQLLEEDSEEARTKILMQMGREGLLKRISATNRTKEQYIESLSKEFKILDVTEKKDED